MYVGMSIWRTRPAMDDEPQRLRSAGARHVFFRQPGIVQANLLALPDTDRRMTLSVWESAEAHERFVAGDLATAVRMYDAVFASGGSPNAALWQVMAGDWLQAR